MNNVCTQQINYYHIILLISLTQYFFEKLYVLLKRLPEFLKELDDKIGANVDIIFNIWSNFEDKIYFYENKGYIRLKYVRLTKDSYMIKIPTKFESNVILNINNKMKSTENITNITNTLRYISLLPIDEQIIEINNTTQHLINIHKNKTRDKGNYKKSIKQIIYLLRLNGIIQIFNRLICNYLMKIAGLKYTCKYYLLLYTLFIINIDLFY